jgi:hypothetical protein
MPLFGPPDVAKLRAKGDVTGLIKALTHGQRSPEASAATVRWSAAEALGTIGDIRAVEPLVAALRDRDKDVRWAGARSLAAIRDRRAVEPLITALRDQDRDVRIAAVQALGTIGDPRAVGPLMAILDQDPHDWVRMVAADALERLGVPGMQGRPQSRALLAALRDQG